MSQPELLSLENLFEQFYKVPTLIRKVYIMVLLKESMALKVWGNYYS